MEIKERLLILFKSKLEERNKFSGLLDSYLEENEPKVTEMIKNIADSSNVEEDLKEFNRNRIKVAMLFKDLDDKTKDLNSTYNLILSCGLKDKVEEKDQEMMEVLYRSYGKSNFVVDGNKFEERVKGKVKEKLQEIINSEMYKQLNNNLTIS